MIEVEIKNFTIGTLVEMMKNGAIDMAPSFQRNANIWSAEKRSRLIESLILGLPLPSFYFSFDMTTKKWVVIDGLQRLGALKAFMIDKTLALTGLEFLEEHYDKWRYDDFAFSDQLNMGMLTVTANVIKGKTPKNVKYILFQRINSAGTPLNPQEIRNALNQGVASSFLLEMSAFPLFRKMVPVDSKRMTDMEYVLRFMAFTRCDYSKYKGKIELFLNDSMALLDTLDANELASVRRDFISCLKLWNDVLGSAAFRNPTLNRGVSKVLFDMLMMTAYKLTDEQRNILRKRSMQFREYYVNLFGDRAFTDLLASGTSKYPKIIQRNDMVREGILKLCSFR